MASTAAESNRVHAPDSPSPNRVPVRDLPARPLALTDDQLTQVMRHAGVLHRGLRRAFVERVAYELRGQVIGDGVVFRACARVLKESGLFDPPQLGSGRVSKWDR
jgi:hypothetical protein